VALTLAFRPNSTTEMLNMTVFEITRCLKQTDGRVAYVYVRPFDTKALSDTSAAAAVAGRS
jgi:hypothetical protein